MSRACSGQEFTSLGQRDLLSFKVGFNNIQGGLVNIEAEQFADILLARRGSHALSLGLDGVGLFSDGGGLLGTTVAPTFAAVSSELVASHFSLAHGHLAVGLWRSHSLGSDLLKLLELVRTKELA